MKTYRQIIIVAFLVVFVAAFALAALASIGKIQMSERALTGFFAVLVTQCIAGIVAAFRTPDFFKEDRKTIAEIETRHAEAIARLAKEHAEADTKNQGVVSQLQQANAAHAQEIAKLKAENQRLSHTLSARKITTTILPS